MTLAYQPAQLVTLINNKGMRITCMDLGATWLSCRLPTGKDLQEVLLGGAIYEDYQNQSAYLGATIGTICKPNSEWLLRAQRRDHKAVNESERKHSPWWTRRLRQKNMADRDNR